MESKKEKLKLFMKELAKTDICLAFSGGVDSSLLLRMASDAAREAKTRVYAVTFDTRLHPPCDLKVAKQVAGEYETVHIIMEVDELSQEAIKTNPVDRCYLCKHYLFTKLKEIAQEKGISVILDGTNEDDLHTYRPGIRALKELGIISPLAALGVTKAEVKAWAAEYGIATASRPSTPCMATRLPYHTKIDYGLLDRIAQGEEWMRNRLDGNIRLRLHGDILRIEVDTASFPGILEMREELSCKMKELGFLYITLDLEGFRSGSMDVGIQ